MSRSSLYEAHADKHGLFLACLDRYHATIVTDWLGPLETPGASLAELRAFFSGALTALLDGDGPKGCLTCNTALEIGSATPDISARIGDYTRRMTVAFERALAAAIARGELPGSTDAHATAEYLFGVLVGLFALARTPVSREAVQRYLAGALRDLS